MNRPRSTTLTGATPVTSIGANQSLMGDVLTLIATASGQSLTNGSNLKLAGNWTSVAAGDTITLVCDGTNWSEVARRNPLAPASAVNAYRVIRDRGGQLTSTGSGTRLALPDTFTASSSATAGRAVFYLDTSEFDVAGYTTKLNLRAVAIVNSTAPATDFTARLVPISAPTGAATNVNVTAGSAVSGSIATFTSPAANSITSVTSSDFTPPAAGLYALAVNQTSAIAASSDVVLRMVLEVRNV